MGTDQLKELKRLQKENERPRRAVSDLTLDKLILGEVAKETSKLRLAPQLYRPGAALVQCFRRPRLPGLVAASLDAPLCSEVPIR